MKSLLAPFSNSQFALDCCAENVDDTKLTQILRYVKSCVGALDRVWNFVQEQAEVPSLRKGNVSQDTADHASGEEEESAVLGMQLHGVNQVCPDQSRDGQFSGYYDDMREVDCQGMTRVKPHTRSCFGRENVGVLVEDAGIYCVHVSKNENESQSAAVKEEVSERRDIKSDFAVAHGDVEDNPYRETEDSMGEDNLEGPEVKEETSELHDVESDCTVAQNDVDENPYRKNYISMCDNNLESSEVRKEISDLHDIESDLTLTCNKSEDYPIAETDAYSSCDNNDNISSSKSELECLRKTDSFSSGSVPECISLYAVSNIGVSGSNTVDGDCLLACESATVKAAPVATYTESSVSCMKFSTHCHGGECSVTGCVCGAEQFHQKLENNLTGDGTEESVCCILEHSIGTRHGLTRSDGGEKVSHLYAEAKGSKVEKTDNNPVVEASSDIVSGCPVSPEADLNNGGEKYLVSEHVEEGVTSHLKVHGNVRDLAQLNTEENETHSGKLAVEQREESGRQECPVWQILKHLECPFKWVPDVFIRRIPNSTIQENMIDQLTGKHRNMIYFVN
jgi:hypothetical protein